jgi:hypothetical protein
MNADVKPLMRSSVQIATLTLGTLVLALSMTGCSRTPSTYLEPGLHLESHALEWLTPCWWEPDSHGNGVPILHVPKDSPTIQHAIDSIPNGGQVVVAAGHYLESIDFHGKNIVVRSAQGPDKTTLDGNNEGVVVAFISGETSSAVLTGFRIINGIGMDDPTYQEGHRQGGGVYIKTASPILTWNKIENNNGQNGGGILCEAGAKPLICYNLIRDNTAVKGGGIRMSNSSPIICNNLIMRNHAERLGGGIYWRQRSLPYIVNNTIIQNKADEFGGGLFGSNKPYPDKWVTLANNLIMQNQAKRGNSIAINLPPTSVKLTNNYIEEGEDGIHRMISGIRVIYEPTNLSDLKPDSINDTIPLVSFPGNGMGAKEWIEMFPVDFLCRPRISVDPVTKERTVCIGAVEVNKQGVVDTTWPPKQNKSE